MRIFPVILVALIAVSSIPVAAVASHGPETPHGLGSANPSQASSSSTQKYYVKYTEYLNNYSLVDGNVNYVSTVPGPAALYYENYTGTYYAASNISSIYSLNSTTYKTGIVSSIGSFPSSIQYIKKYNSLYILPGRSNLTEWNLTSGSFSNITLSPDSYPQSMVYDPADSTMFVAVQGGGVQGSTNTHNSLVAVNLSSGSVAYNISLGFGPFGLAYDSNNGYIYVSFPNGQFVSVFNPSTRSFLNNQKITIPIGGAPYEFAIDRATNTVYLTNQGFNQVTVINGNTQKITGKIPVGSLPSGIVFNSETGTLFVANTDSSNITVINASTNSVVQNIGVGSEPYAIAVDTNNSNVLVADHGSNSLSIVTPIKRNDVTFSEEGLPVGSVWSVTLNGTTRYSNSDTITFDAGDGTMHYSLSQEKGYYSSSTGSLKISGNTYVTVKYHSVAALHNELISVGVLIAVIAAVTGVWFMRRRKKL